MKADDRYDEHLTREFETPSENEEHTVFWGWGGRAPVYEQKGARAPQAPEIFGGRTRRACYETPFQR
jgi:hypothetical protein